MRRFWRRLLTWGDLSARRSAGAGVVLLTMGCGAEHDLIIGWRDASDGGGAGAIGSAGGPGEEDSSFRLLFREEFESLSPERWDLAEHTFDENLADFVRENALLENGRLRLLVDEKPAEMDGKRYRASEVRTVEEFRYGKFVVSARLAPGSGIVSTFFSFHDFFRYDRTANYWNEIVMEGAPPNRLHCSVAIEDPSAPDRKGVSAVVGEVPFDVTEQFHSYGFEWTPTELRFLVDGQLHHVETYEEGDLARPHRLVMSAYPSRRTVVAGVFDPSVLPVYAEYEWLEVYEYTGLIDVLSEP